ncbi:pyridoxal 4-dehydrogenase [Sphingomonas spermidinifaciens]|uniref:Pyridoxal 4-dehydrogenase n=1 Tax=Sphingomonas spermidinifaciens TaxID=1141889 RepID=A0A2A4B800_9SPHN|nr:aldo/keto reductase [Sphingomonas spermidinifaciens]PCD04210.1 pyridoxal 4-dehydrogenase [Sphingomonas spermidinifaciens]
MDRIAQRTLVRSDLSLSEIGCGAASLGNLYRPVADAEARATLDAALAAGMTYVDTAPRYGHGLSERRVGDVLRGRDGIVLSSKVGRLFCADPALAGDAARHGFRSPMPFEARYDYSYDGVMRSWEDSLQRLGLGRIDILYVHDIGGMTHADEHDRTFAELTKGGGLRALEVLRADGAIGAFGLGVNECDVVLQAMNYADLDVVLLAGRYTLLEQGALDALLPACERRGVSIVVGGAYNSGILATGTRRDGPIYYDYGAAPPDIVDHVRWLEALCDRHAVPLAAAALQFPLAHPQVVSVIPGLGSVGRVQQTMDLYHQAIPADFWRDLRAVGLVDVAAPLPGGA